MANTANIKAIITAEDKASGVLRGFSRSVEGLGSQITTTMKVAAAAFASAATAGVVFGVKVAGELEASRQGFYTLLGTIEEADRIMNRIKKEAARTPFEIRGLTQATQMLTAVTKDGDRALEFILHVGEGLAAMGRGQAELDRVAVNLQQIAATGRAFGIDIRQFAFAGIPIYEMLREEIGLTGEALDDFIQDGGVTFELLEKMFAKATGAGGRWEGAFQKQFGTFNQLVSNAKDNLAIFASDFVKQTGIFDAAKRAIGAFNTVITENKQAIISTVNIGFGALARVLPQIIENIRKLADQISTYLGPKIVALWHTLEEKLFPVLVRLWREVLQPLVPVIGTALVVALGLAIDALNILFAAVTPVVNFLIDNKEFLTPIIQSFIILKGVMMLNAAFNAIQVGFATLQLVQIPSLMTSLAALRLSFLAAFPFAVILSAAVLAFEKIRSEAEKTKQALDSTVKASESAASQQGYIIKSAKEAYAAGRISKERMNSIIQGSAVGARASGGPVSANSPYLVGERGPELFVPSSAGSIVPNNKTGGTVNINVNVGMYAGTEMEKRKMAEQLMRAFKDVADSKNMAWGI